MSLSTSHTITSSSSDELLKKLRGHFELLEGRCHIAAVKILGRMKARKAVGSAFRLWMAASRCSGSSPPSFEAELLKLKADVTSLRAEVDSDRTSRLAFESRIMANLYALEARISAPFPQGPELAQSGREGVSVLSPGQPNFQRPSSRPDGPLPARLNDFPPPPHVLEALYNDAKDSSARSGMFRRTSGVLFRWAGEPGTVCVNVDQEMARAWHRLVAC